MIVPVGKSIVYIPSSSHGLSVGSIELGVLDIIFFCVFFLATFPLFKIWLMDNDSWQSFKWDAWLMLFMLALMDGSVGLLVALIFR